MNPLVSVIIPFTEDTSSFVKCLDSLVNQTLTRIEVILVNDGATPDAVQLVKDYQDRDQRITVVPEDQETLALNRGLACASGEYVTFLDQDGWVGEETYENLYKIATQDQTDILMGNGVYCYKSGRKTEIYKSSTPPVEEHILSGTEAFVFLSKYGEVNLTPAISLYKKEFIEKNQHSFQSHIHQDELWGPMTLCTAERVKIIGYSFYSWYQSPISYRVADRFEERYHALTNLAEQLKLFIDRYSFETEEKAVKSWLFVRLMCIYHYAVDQLKNAQLDDFDRYKERILPVIGELGQLDPVAAEAADIYYRLIRNIVKNHYACTLPEK